MCALKVYIDGRPVTFRREKTKEYLAYLVDRGTLCTGEEIAAALWEDSVAPRISECCGRICSIPSPGQAAQMF